MPGDVNPKRGLYFPYQPLPQTCDYSFDLSSSDANDLQRWGKPKFKKDPQRDSTEVLNECDLRTPYSATREPRNLEPSRRTDLQPHLCRADLICIHCDQHSHLGLS
ncbi:dual specificity protein phosphatase 14 isoform X4 [Manis pentadactyla]|uniref:dual specificity protein phosphatase 14 isoform X4 n=1 Tax=Manis pentadactyla TaxID=143292 RepID=UPI00255C3F93|nr:dual specificity protein phosphatase 14 isoform X4 [Manis pentadactyla]